MIINDTIKSIMNRYSCRNFLQEAVTDEELETVLEAGKYTANGRNRQTWHFTAMRFSYGSRQLTFEKRKCCKLFINKKAALKIF